MVNQEKLLSFIFKTYKKLLGDNICLFIVGGSVGRKNFINGWSDADLLLVLQKTDSNSLKMVKKCENILNKKYNIEMDTMIISEITLKLTEPKKLHGKVKNFIYFIKNAVVLIKKNELTIPQLSKEDFIYGFWATYADQEKRFLRRNADINKNDIVSLQKLAKKNIKIIFLILKQFLAKQSSSVPSTYSEVILQSKNIFKNEITKKLKKYELIRNFNQLTKMPKKELTILISETNDVFNSLNKIIF